MSTSSPLRWIFVLIVLFFRGLQIPKKNPCINTLAFTVVVFSVSTKIGWKVIKIFVLDVLHL